MKLAQPSSSCPATPAFSAVTLRLFGLAALVVARAGDPPPYELFGYALSTVPGSRHWPPSGEAGSGPLPTR